jgi:hypothetical protein
MTLQPPRRCSVSRYPLPTPEFAMESTTVEENTLQVIHHPSDVQLLDDIDKLRSHGISHLVALPQLVVCGDQSSGKSSVLEAISGIPFPTKDNLCTRFATEVVLRRTSTAQVSVTITPGPGREHDEAQKLQQFNMTLTDLKVFGEVLENAKTAMGVVDGGSAFTDDVLRIDISGPDRPHLTVVDCNDAQDDRRLGLSSDTSPHAKRRRSLTGHVMTSDAGDTRRRRRSRRTGCIPHESPWYIG